MLPLPETSWMAPSRLPNQSLSKQTNSSTGGMALPRIIQERGINFSLELSPDKEHARHSRVQETFRVGMSRRRSLLDRD
ncbi:hypothetical protein BDQ94DRAFT_144501 [Aspergillus welwitschiae]|uniref:Uncharacterized protein n=1 Tax=Aspergillus welwitschiae TaxID=1341132 RepID=A0A3F3Q1L1_9EURO|nr:hypothetical protein BDQ94DRAFT_144501 [Aspergillus welwitschiae]RDH33103.1 hypothetical protein BDQ94DRAFT_144501 [Aspergillus welwitschiae]